VRPPFDGRDRFGHLQPGRGGVDQLRQRAYVVGSRLRCGQQDNQRGQRAWDSA
jgi:hypothetical protein